MSRFLLLVFSLIFVSVAAIGQSAPAHETNVLWYARQARLWMTEDLPLGNGSLGGMLFGLTGTERVQFNANIQLHAGVYCWFGEHKIEGDAGNYAQVGVHVYSSRDLSGYVGILSLKP